MNNWYFVGFIALAIGLYNMQKSSLGGEDGMLAIDLIHQELKDPSSATWNSVVFAWKGDGRSLVEVDVSAKNGFGGTVRSDFCVCVAPKVKQGKVLTAEGGCGIKSRMPAMVDVFKNECNSLAVRSE